MSNNTQPTHYAYSVKEREGKNAIWTKIGAVFAAKGGMTIQLDALPLGDRIVLREPKEDTAAKAKAE